MKRALMFVTLYEAVAGDTALFVLFAGVMAFMWAWRVARPFWSMDDEFRALRNRALNSRTLTIIPAFIRQQVRPV